MDHAPAHASRRHRRSRRPPRGKSPVLRPRRSAATTGWTTRQLHSPCRTAPSPSTARSADPSPDPIVAGHGAVSNAILHGQNVASAVRAISPCIAIPVSFTDSGCQTPHRFPHAPLRNARPHSLAARGAVDGERKHPPDQRRNPTAHHAHRRRGQCPGFRNLSIPMHKSPARWAIHTPPLPLRLRAVSSTAKITTRSAAARSTAAMARKILTVAVTAGTHPRASISPRSSSTNRAHCCQPALPSISRLLRSF